MFLWLAAHAAFKEDRYLELAERAALHSFEAESQIGSICCGLAGQAYAMTALYRSTQDNAWLHRAQALAERAALAFGDAAAGHSDPLAERPDSLFKGELGVAVLAAGLESIDACILPAFEHAL